MPLPGLRLQWSIDQTIVKGACAVCSEVSSQGWPKQKIMVPKIDETADVNIVNRDTLKQLYFEG